MTDAHRHVCEPGPPECKWPTEIEAVIDCHHSLPEYGAIAKATGISMAILVHTLEVAADAERLIGLGMGKLPV